MITRQGVIYYLSLIFTASYLKGLDVCEDHYNDCPQSQCGEYPLPLLYRYHCMKTCGVCTNINRALGKPTAQISTRGNSVSDRGVDGNINNDKTANSCTKTNETGLRDQWWCVDLQAVYHIDTIKIYSLKDNQKTSLTGFKIKLGLDGHCNDISYRRSTTCYTDLTWITQSIYTINQCNGDSLIHLVGRFVFISTAPSLTSNRPLPLSLCEVGIYTGTKCNAGYYSYNSTTCVPCNTCKESSCYEESGICLEGCINGFRGSKCTECIKGRFGPACRYACNTTQCLGNCDSVTGTCSECKHGYFGRNCQSLCDSKCLNGICLQSDGSCQYEKEGIYEETSHVPTSSTDNGLDRTAVGIIGVLVGTIITCLALFTYRVIKRRRRRISDQKTFRMTPKPVRPPPVPEDVYIPSFESLSSQYIEVTDPYPVSNDPVYLRSREIPPSFRSEQIKSLEKTPRRISVYSLDNGKRFDRETGRSRKLSAFSLNVDNGYESAQTSRRYSSTSIENRPPADLPGSGAGKIEKSEIPEEYQTEGYDPYEHVTSI